MPHIGIAGKHVTTLSVEWIGYHTVVIVLHEVGFGIIKTRCSNPKLLSSICDRYLLKNTIQTSEGPTRIFTSCQEYSQHIREFWGHKVVLNKDDIRPTWNVHIVMTCQSQMSSRPLRLQLSYPCQGKPLLPSQRSSHHPHTTTSSSPAQYPPTCSQNLPLRPASLPP